jgi:hypothetical protein
MADLLAWCFHSPRRVLLVLVALLVVVFGVGAAVQTMTPQGEPSATRSAPTAVAADIGPAVEAAVTFTRAWSSKPGSASADQWRQGLQPLVTPELARLLATTDPAELPGGAPTGRPVVRFVSAASALVEVQLTTGQEVLVTTVLLNGRWLTSDVQPAEGDDGDVGTGSTGASPGSGAGAGDASAAAGSAG